MFNFIKAFKRDDWMYVKVEEHQKICKELSEVNEAWRKRKKAEQKAKDKLIKQLIEENKELKEKLEQIKEAYIRFEDSGKEYNKWLWELDQLIMNR